MLVGSFHGIKSYVVCAPTADLASVAMREGEKASSLNKLDSLYRVLLMQARPLALALLRMLPRCRFGAGSSSFGGTTNCWSNRWPPFERCARERGLASRLRQGRAGKGSRCAGCSCAQELTLSRQMFWLRDPYLRFADRRTDETKFIW